MGWGGYWGGGPSIAPFDFKALFDSKRWKQLDFAENYEKIIQFMADTFAEWDGWIVAETIRVGVDAAVGDEIDDWGAMVGIRRNGMGDTTYRRAVKAKARANLGQGDIQTIYDIVAIFSDGNAKATVLESFPANYIVWLHGLTLIEQQQVGALFEGVPGLGIGAYIIIVDPDGVFAWAGASTPTVAKHWSGASAPASESAGFAGGVTL
jgi:hypothetical protein